MSARLDVHSSWFVHSELVRETASIHGVPQHTDFMLQELANSFSRELRIDRLERRKAREVTA